MHFRTFSLVNFNSPCFVLKIFKSILFSNHLQLKRRILSASMVIVHHIETIFFCSAGSQLAQKNRREQSAISAVIKYIPNGKDRRNTREGKAGPPSTLRVFFPSPTTRGGTHRT